MKIYYAASIWGAQGDDNFNLEMIACLKKHATVLSEHLFLSDYKNKEHLDKKAIHDRDLAWVNEADLIVAEFTSPSLGVGYELREAAVKGKQIVVLYKPQEGKRLSAMISGSDGAVTVFEYQNLADAKQKIEAFFKK